MLTKLRAGGGFETLMSENGGAYQPHVEGCFLDIVPQQRIVFTTLLKQGWQPIEPWLAMTSIITMEDEAGGTKYIARALHRNPTDSQKHEEMGFHKGWAGVGAKRPALRAFLSLVAAYLRIPAGRVTGWLWTQSAANGSRSENSLISVKLQATKANLSFQDRSAAHKAIAYQSLRDRIP